MLRIVKVLLYLLLFLAPFAPRWVPVYHHVANLMPEFSSTVFYLTDVLLILVVVLWLAAHLLDRSRLIRLGPWFTALPLAVLVVLSGLSCLWATSRAICVEAFLRLAWLWVLYLLVRNEIDNEPLAAGMLAAGLVVQSGMAMLQFDRQAPVGLSFLGETGGPPMDWFRGHGFSPHPNILGGYLPIDPGGSCRTDRGLQRAGRGSHVSGLSPARTRPFSHRAGLRREAGYLLGNQDCILFSSAKSPDVLTLPVIKAFMPPSLPVARAT